MDELMNTIHKVAFIVAHHHSAAEPFVGVNQHPKSSGHSLPLRFSRHCLHAAAAEMVDYFSRDW
jgi:hypothetical protein